MKIPILERRSRPKALVLRTNDRVPNCRREALEFAFDIGGGVRTTGVGCTDGGANREGRTFVRNWLAVLKFEK